MAPRGRGVNANYSLLASNRRRIVGELEGVECWSG